MADFKIATVEDRALESVPVDAKALCCIISSNTATLMEKSDKMKEVVQNSLALGNFRPSKPTPEQKRLWDPIDECAVTSSEGYISLVRTQQEVVKHICLLASATAMFSALVAKGVSFNTAIARVNDAMKAYHETSATFSSNSQIFIEKMTRVIEGMVRNLPGITGVQSALDSTMELLRQMKQLHAKWMALEQDHSGKLGTATGNYQKARAIRETLETTMSAEKERYGGSVRAARDAEAARNVALQRQADAQDKTITESKQRVVTTHHPGYKKWSWWGWSYYRTGGHSTTETVTDYHTRVDTSERENATRKAAAATSLQQLQEANKHSAQAAAEAATKIFAKALQDETEAKAALDSATKLAQEQIHQAQQDYLAAKATYDAGVVAINDAVDKTGVDQKNVVRFIHDALVVRDGALNSSIAAATMAANMSTMSALLKQNFEVPELKIAELSVREVIASRAKQLVPFTEYIVNELGLEDRACCVMERDDMPELVKSVQEYANTHNLTWKVAMSPQLTRLATGALFQPTEEEKADLADRLGTQQVICDRLSAVSTYLTQRGVVVKRQLDLCAEINSQNARLR